MLFLRLYLVSTLLCNFQIRAGSLCEWLCNCWGPTKSCRQAGWQPISEPGTVASSAPTRSTASVDLRESGALVVPFLPLLPPNIVLDIEYWDWSGIRIVRDNLGEGRNGKTKGVQFPNNSSNFALKTISKSRIGNLPNGVKNAISEIKTQRETNHNNVVKLHTAYEDRDNIYIVTELCEGGDLFEAMNKYPENRFDESKAKQTAWGIAHGIKHLHDLYIVHRDLKLDNIFLTPEGVPKIGDFGYAKKIYNKRIYYLEGSKDYMAPEVVANYGHSFPADIWSFGVIIFCMMEGYFPFYSDTPSGVQLMMHGRFKFWRTESESAKDLINHMLVVDVDNRYTIDQVIAHPWFDDMRDILISSQDPLSSEQRLGDTEDSTHKEGDNLRVLSVPI